MKQLYILSLLVFCFHYGYAQKNTDSIFSVAISEAKDQDYIHAVNIANTAYNSDPKRGDILVFIANVYSWQQKNDSALIYIAKAQKLNYHQSDFYVTWTNILLRSQQYDALLLSCSEAEKYNYSAEDILKKRLIAYTALKSYDTGLNLAELPENRLLLKNDPVRNLYTNLQIKRKTNIITAHYSLDFFDSVPQPQHLASLDYLFHLSDNSLAIRGNYANRFGLNDFQLETDFYLLLKKQQYLYFNYGYGINSKLFPRHRVGFEYYFPMIYKMDASLGTRYMQYANSDVLILTGHLSKYFGKNWLALRPYYVIRNDKNTSLSLIGNYRIYGKNEYEFWGLELGYGNSPDELYSTIQPGTFLQLNSYKVKLERNIIFNNVSELRIGIGYTNEEYQTSMFRNRYSLELGYKFRMK